MRFSLNLDKQYTYTDYLTWWDVKHHELINRFIRMMSLASKTRYREVSGNLSGELRQIIKN
jgi:hypothetical protein